MGIRKFKLWQKILLFVAAGIVFIVMLLFAGGIILNNYLRKEIEKSFNQRFDAELNIDRLRISLLSSKVSVSGVSIVENVTENNYELLNIESAYINFSGFLSSDKLLNIKEINFVSPQFYSIIYKDGQNLWKRIVPEKTKISVDIDDDTRVDRLPDVQDFDFLINKISILNAGFYYNNMHDNIKNSFENISVYILTNNLDGKITIDYEAFADIGLGLTNNDNFNSFKAVGLLNFEKSPLRLHGKSDLYWNSYKINNYLELINIGDDKYRFVSDLFYSFDDVQDAYNDVCEGSLSFNTKLVGKPSDLKNISYTANFVADKVLLSNNNSDFENIFHADFNVLLETSLYEDKINLQIDSFFVRLNNDTVSGSISLLLGDSFFIFNNSIFGKIDLQEFNNFSKSDRFKSGYLKISSGEKIFPVHVLLKRDEDFIFSARDINFEIYNQRNILVDELSFNLGRYYFSQKLIFSGRNRHIKNHVEVKGFNNIFNEEDYHLSVEFYSNRVSIPDIPSPRRAKPSEPTEPRDFEFDLFPKNNSYSFNINIDTLSYGKSTFKYIDISGFIDTNNLKITTLYALVKDGYINANIEIYRNPFYQFTDLDIDINNLDLNYISGDSRLRSGRLNVMANSRLYEHFDGHTDINNSSGRNEIYLTNFDFENSGTIASEFYDSPLLIDSLGIVVLVDGEKIIFEPVSTKIGESLLSFSGLIDDETVDIRSIIQLPEDELIPRTRIMLNQLVTETMYVTYPINPDYYNLLITVTGKKAKPDYEIIRLKQTIE